LSCYSRVRGGRSDECFHPTPVATLPPHEPSQKRQDRTHNEHRRDWKNKLQSRPVDENVAGEMEKRHPLEPRPEQAGEDEYRAKGDENAIHRFAAPGMRHAQSMGNSTVLLSQRGDGRSSHSITDDEFLQHVPMALQMILGAVAHESHGTPSGELLQQSQRKLLTMVLNDSAVPVDRTVQKEFP
jgi:hypothetical protein